MRFINTCVIVFYKYYYIIITNFIFHFVQLIYVDLQLDEF